MKEDGFYIHLMREASEKIRQYTQAGKQAFFESSLIQDAVVRNFEKISDAAAKITDEYKEKRPAVAWEELASLKHVLLYPDLDAVWNSVERDIPALLREIDSL